jgi:hypothetical protein
MRRLASIVLALAALLHSVGVAAQTACAIPPAPPPRLERHGTITVIFATATITVTNTGQACGRQLSFAPDSRLEIVRQPGHGSVALTGPRFDYTPSPGYVGPDSFVIRIVMSEQAFGEWTFDVSVVTPEQAR